MTKIKQTEWKLTNKVFETVIFPVSWQVKFVRIDCYSTST